MHGLLISFFSIWLARLCNPYCGGIWLLECITSSKNREYTDFFSLALRTIGALALVLTSCALADLNFDDIYNFSSGGVIGSLFSKALLPWFNMLGATLALLSVWAIGFTLFTGWSWLTITEKIGAVILGAVAFITNRGQKILTMMIMKNPPILFRQIPRCWWITTPSQNINFLRK